MQALNQYHRQVCRWLSRAGIQYTEEFPVGPYSLDIYIPDQRLGVEVDGPFHNRRQDWERDKLIRDHFGIRIVRVKVGAKKQECMETILGKREK